MTVWTTTFALAFQAFSLFAQLSPGTLVGVVEGQAGCGLAAALVRLTAEDSSRVFDMTVDATGRFAFAGIPPGLFTLEVTLHGRQPYRQTHLAIASARTLEITIRLPPIATPGRRAGTQVSIFDRDVGWGTSFTRFSLKMLPNARHIWSSLESQEPSTVTDRLDVAGLEAGVPALFGALGASWTENQYSLNGFNLTDPYTTGRPLFDPDVDAISELEVATAVKPAMFASSGATVAMATLETPATFHVITRWFFSGREIESDNMDNRLRRLGFLGPERLNHLADGNVQMGGKLPVAQAAWPFFISLSAQDLSKDLGGFAAPIGVHAYRALVAATPYSQASRRLNVFTASQHVLNSRQGADLRISPSATRRGDDNYFQGQVSWSESLGSAAWLDIGFGISRALVSSGIQRGLAEVSTLDLPLLDRSGAAEFSQAGSRTRYEANGMTQIARDGLGGSHALNLGSDWSWSSFSNHWDALKATEQVLANGMGAEVVKWNTPTEARGHVENFAVFAQDAWRPARWLSVPLGLRLETSSGRAAGVDRGISWTALQPRAGMAVSLAHRGPVWRVSWSRYAHQLQGRYLDFGNPNALGGEIFRWHDLDGDGQAQPGELSTLLRVFGGPHSAMDRGIAQPFTDEFSAGLDEEFGPHFHALLRFFRRDDHRLIGLTNLGVPLSGYTPVSVLDPGNDGIPGTGDDQVLTLYDQKVCTLGHDFLLLTNPPGGHASFKGFEIRLMRPWGQRWEFSGSFMALRTLAATNPGNSVEENDAGVIGELGMNPNTFILARSRTFFDRAFIGKATGSYRTRHGLEISAVAKYYDGLPFGRLLFVNGFNQGPFFVRATPRGHPGGFQTQFNATLDVRLAREFQFQRGNLTGYFDVFNLTNFRRNTSEADLTGPAFQARVPLSIETPRTARVGFEWQF